MLRFRAFSLFGRRKSLIIKVIIVLLFLLYFLLSFKKIKLDSIKYAIAKFNPLKKPFGYSGVKEYAIRNTRIARTFPPNLNVKDELAFILSKADSKYPQYFLYCYFYF